MRILILGADGYLGWPTAMHLSNKNHEIVAVDNYFRRSACVELDCESLIPCPNLKRRVSIWKEITGNEIGLHIGDITDYSFLGDVFKTFRPEAVVHYAEQPSAPFSMINREKAVFTLRNNLIGTLNIIHAVKEYTPSCHIVKLGTMGEYGTPNIDIEEGWIDIEHKGRKDKFLFPRQAGSLYHTTKIQDTDLLWFYVRVWGLRVTDLMQGPVYGIVTDDTELDQRLSTIFNYDEIFGTVVNRFVVQAVSGYPLTVYGKGGQTRGYLNLKDTLACVELAILHPPKQGELKVYNQVTETFSVTELAEKVARVGKARKHAVTIKKIKNPRIELEEHYYNPTYTGLKSIGLNPHLLTDKVMHRLFELVEKHKDKIEQHKIFRGIKWQKY